MRANKQTEARGFSQGSSWVVFSFARRVRRMESQTQTRMADGDQLVTGRQTGSRSARQKLLGWCLSTTLVPGLVAFEALQRTLSRVCCSGIPVRGRLQTQSESVDSRLGAPRPVTISPVLVLVPVPDFFLY